MEKHVKKAVNVLTISLLVATDFPFVNNADHDPPAYSNSLIMIGNVCYSDSNVSITTHKKDK